MKIDILTLFPNMFDGIFSESIIKRAIEKKLIEINLVDFRKYSLDKHNKVDDTPFGGGSGMVLMCQPIFDAVNDLKEEDTTVILLTPDGLTFKQEMAKELSLKKHLIIICGHYEGFDDRIRTIVDLEISIGDFILTGGEVASMILTDAITRLIPGVITQESLVEESFNNNLLDYPTYTKPQNFRDLEVPEVLISGNHQEIKKYRYEEQVKRTNEKRPDLLNK
ncbi:MAG TPA: tRNA (guanosine(37)-N1)-methyltransferase TrmD [Bacilli bacterium]|nr:tRNA (guanosine(37)-N1)-methyltransferase TrmD [Bacilli bacterium]